MKKNFLNERMRSKKFVAFGEMFLLISLSFAVSFIFAEEVGVVDAKTATPTTPIATGGAGLGSANTFSSYTTAKGGLNSFGVIGADGKISSVAASSNTLISSDGANLINGANKYTWDASAGAWKSTTVGAGTKFSFGGLFKGSAFGPHGAAGVFSALTSGAIYGGLVYGATLLIANALGLSNSQAKSLATGLGLGTFAGTTSGFLANNFATTGFLAQHPAIFGTLIGAGVATVIILATYKKEKKEIVKFECFPWEAPLGGSQCEICNENPLLPCSEYRCKSLGQACDIINKGTEEEKCVWINREDTQAPKIIPWDEALKPIGLTYRPDPTISPPNTGFRIVSQDNGCLDPFTRLEFGFTTVEINDKPENAQCKIDLELKNTYDEMSSFVGNTNIFRIEHTQEIKIPSPFTEEGDAVPDIHNNGIYTLWTRCIDANGNGQDSAAVAFRFCVNRGPDLREPIIEGFSIVDGSPVRFDVDSVPIEVYVNEPAECRWSRQDKAFDAMENPMECATETYQINSELNYVCAGSLTGVKNRESNNFYFRCKDQPNKPENERNVMTESKNLLLKGTEELVILEVGPNGIFEGGSGTNVVTVNLTVETGHGADDGAATCYFSDVNQESSFRVPMQGGGTHAHSQPLDLIAGDYIYHFRCVDAGGNSATAQTNFSVEIDTGIPEITRAFRDRDSLKIITNEDAKCVYSLNSCNYNIEEVTETIFRYEDAQKRTNHIAPWAVGKTYYVKCADFQGNQPAPTSCQLIVQGSEL